MEERKSLDTYYLALVVSSPLVTVISIIKIYGNAAN